MGLLWIQVFFRGSPWYLKGDPRDLPEGLKRFLYLLRFQITKFPVNGFQISIKILGDPLIFLNIDGIIEKSLGISEDSWNLK